MTEDFYLKDVSLFSTEPIDVILSETKNLKMFRYAQHDTFLQPTPIQQ